MRISVTERGTWKRCTDSWGYYRIDELVPIITSTAFIAGTLHHAGLEAWTNDPTLTAQQLDEVYMTLAKEEVLKACAVYKEQTGMNFMTTELEPYWEAVTLGRAMMKNYHEYHHTPLPPGFTPIQMEQTIVVPIPNAISNCKICINIPDWGKAVNLPLWSPQCRECNGTGQVQHYLEGKVDGVLTSNETGLYYVLERKTYGARPNADSLEYNDQFLGYDWLLGNIVGFENAVGIAYDGAWKRATPPKGRVMSDLFYRTLLTRSQHELKLFGEQLAVEAMAMYNTTRYTNRRWEGCYDCSYKKLCDAKWKGDDLESIKRVYYTKHIRGLDMLVATESATE